MPLQRVPLFPLNTVLYPGIRLPLRIFEPRYHEMLDALEKGDGLFAVALTEDPEAGRPASARRVGCLARLLQVSPPGDVRFILAEGTARFLSHGTVRERAFDEAEVAILPEEWGEGAEKAAEGVIAALAPFFAAVCGEGATLSREPCALSYQVAHALPVDLATRQLLLEAPDAAERLALEARLLVRLAPSLEATARARNAHLN